jgi:hypothetical protein
MRMATEFERLFGLTTKHTRPLMQQADMVLPHAPSGRALRARVVAPPKSLFKQRDLLDASFAFLLMFTGAMLFLI